MPRVHDEAAIPALPSQIKARFDSERKANARYCAACGRRFSGGSSTRKNCFACAPYPAACDRRIAARPKADVSRQNLLKHAHKRMGKRERACVRCGYALFVDVCHIRRVCSFPDDTLIGVINAPSNLVFLCPNCHREFDAGLWDLPVERDSGT